jgi:uncharacterized Zn finger protein
MPPIDAPSAVTAPCPDCGEETLHEVLKATVATRGGGLSLSGTVQCTECSRVHHATVKQAPDVEVPAVVSKGKVSRRTVVKLPGEEEVSVGEAFVVDGVNSKLTGIEDKDMRRVEAAAVKDIRTVWLIEFEEVSVGFAINLGKKTIAKAIPSLPEREFSVGEEHLFGRLRVTVHAIKTKERLIKRGSAEAGEIARIFAAPTPLGDFKHRPDKRSREQMRSRTDE